MIVYCTYVAPLLVVCRVEVEPEQEAAPFVKDPEIEPRQQGKQPPFDHVDKNPIPSQSRLCMKRMIVGIRSRKQKNSALRNQTQKRI